MKFPSLLHTEKAKRNTQLTLAYAVLFALTALGVFAYFLVRHQSFITLSDAVSQHYTSLHYLGGLLRGLLRGEGFPMWSWQLGWGADVPATLSYYVLGDPISLLSVFAKSAYTEQAYTILLILRFYLCGISFLIYSRHMGLRALPSLAGALMYAFMGYTVTAMVHPFFLNPCIYLPLLLLGIERIYQKKSPLLFILMVFISGVSNYYFFFMLSAMVLLYALVRFFDYQHGWRAFWAVVGRCLLYYVAGVLMAAILLLPVIYGVLEGARSSHEVFPKYLYPISYYASTIMGWNASTGAPFWAKTTYAAPALLLLPVFFLRRHEYGGFFRLLIFLFIMTLFPIFGYLLNGCAYVANRWMFAYGFLVCFLTAWALQKGLSRREKNAMCIVFVLYCVGAAGYSLLGFQFPWLALVLGLACLLVLYFWEHLSRLRLRYFPWMLLFVIIAGHLAYNGWISYETTGVYSSLAIPAGSIEDTYRKQGAILKGIQDTDFFRVTKTYSIQGNNTFNYGSNDGLVQDYNGTQAFFSMLPQRMFDRYTLLGLRTRKYEAMYGGNDNRTVLETLSGVRYMALKTGEAQYLPYGYSLIAQKGSYRLYRNKYSLGVGVVYPQYMTASDYAHYSPLEREQLLLQGVVLEQNIPGLPKVQPQTGVTKLHYTIMKKKGVSIRGNTLTVTQSKGYLVLDCPKVQNAELYAGFNGLEMLRPFQDKNGSKEDLREILYGGEGSRSFTLLYRCGSVTKNITCQDPTSRYYIDNGNGIINLGYRAEQNRKIIIVFYNPGVYRYDSLSVWSASMDQYPQRVDALRQTSLRNVTYGKNTLRGTVALTQKGILSLSIPYSKGWTAYVDGKKSTIYPANTMFMAVPLDAGNHTIVLRYCTPGLVLGAWLSLVGVLLAIGVCWRYRFTRRRIGKD